jgi:hypothetical protein
MKNKIELIYADEKETSSDEEYYIVILYEEESFNVLRKKRESKFDFVLKMTPLEALEIFEKQDWDYTSFKIKTEKEARETLQNFIDDNLNDPYYKQFKMIGRIFSYSQGTKTKTTICSVPIFTQIHIPDKKEIIKAKKECKAQYENNDKEREKEDKEKRNKIRKAPLVKGDKKFKSVFSKLK